MSTSSPHEADRQVPGSALDRSWFVTWLPLFVLAVAPLLLFRHALWTVVVHWQAEEYSHGYLIPLIAAFMVWQRRHVLAAGPFTGSWYGPAVVGLGLIGVVVGQLSAITLIDIYFAWLVVVGLALSVLARRAFSLVLPALFLLVLAIPLPQFIYQGLSSQLQLMSSELGVAVIRLLGVSVYLEGNVIDLGSMKLQVVEACNGLRYLFPLITLGYIAAYFFRAPLWMRVVLVLSTIPITVLMNSFRIGVIGVLVDRYGRGQAEGFLHDFEGWIVFMACFAVLFVLMWLLVRISGDKRSFADVFALELSPPALHRRVAPKRSMPTPGWIALGLLLSSAVPISALPYRNDVRPMREEFSAFPMQIGEWHGQRERLDPIYFPALQLDDYEKAVFVKDGTGLVTLFSAYYASQRSGQSAHSPRSCLPGGGWKMEGFGQRQLEGVTVGGRPLVVNRTVIKQGDDALLVYYWFQERGRIITNEYLVKWYILVDALLRNRTDGALVRVVTPLSRGEDISRADLRLTEFAKLLVAELPKYIPD